MKWWEFKKDNGDGSFSAWRFKTKEEAEKSLEWCENNLKWFSSDGDGVNPVDTESGWFFSTYEDIKKDYS